MHGSSDCETPIIPYYNLQISHPNQIISESPSEAVQSSNSQPPTQTHIYQRHQTTIIL